MTRSKSRYFATAVRMDEAFLALLERKDFEYITVKEICAAAGVNRSTFYLHYETIGDLLAESTQYLTDQFRASMPRDAASLLEKLPSCPLEELYFVTADYLEPYLLYIRAHRRVFRTALENASVLRLNDTYTALSRHILLPVLDRFGVPAEDQKYMIRFYIHGIIAIITEWLSGDCREPVGHIVSVIQRCAGRGAP